MRIINQVDPLTRQPEAGLSDGGMSPMDPPEAYFPPALDRVPVEDMHPFLQTLCEDHSAMSAALSAVDAALLSVKSTGFTANLEQSLFAFCQVVDCDFIPHSRREEESLFPLLHERLIQDGEHSKGRSAFTAVDLMRDDHTRVIQMLAVIVNFLKIAGHLPDERSTLVLRDAALRHVKALVQLLRLHMFREDNIVFGAAHRLISSAEFERMQVDPRQLSAPVQSQLSQ